MLSPKRTVIYLLLCLIAIVFNRQAETLKAALKSKLFMCAKKVVCRKINFCFPFLTEIEKNLVKLNYRLLLNDYSKLLVLNAVLSFLSKF